MSTPRQEVDMGNHKAITWVTTLTLSMWLSITINVGCLKFTYCFTL